MANYRVSTVNDVKFFEASSGNEAEERAQKFLAEGKEHEVVLEQEVAKDQWEHRATMRRAEAAE